MSASATWTGSKLGRARHVIAAWDALPGRRFQELKRLEIDLGEAGCATVRIMLVGADPDDVVWVRFQGVHGVRFQQTMSNVIVGPLRITDVQSRGWDDTAFEVRDPEQSEAISFYSKTFEWSLGSYQPDA